MTADEWAKILEQLLLLFLIIGRWLLPKGDITRDQLSQLLLVNIGMAADIIELFEAFREEQVKYNYTLTVVILSLWTGSLCQFTLVVTATKARKPRVAIAAQRKEKSVTCFCCETEIWAILTSILLQDGPFLVLRMLLIFRYDVVSYMNVFFTCKNTLVMLLQLYRIAVVILERQIKRRHEDNDTETISLSMSRSHSGLSRISQHSRLDRIPKSRSLGGLVQNNKSNNHIDHSSYPCLNSKSAGDLTYIDDSFYPRPTLKPRYPKEERLFQDSSHHKSDSTNSISGVAVSKNVRNATAPLCHSITISSNDLDSDKLPLAKHDENESPLATQDSVV